MDALEMEYTALRNEIVKRIELRQQIIVITLTIAGIFLGFGIKEKTRLISLVYPPIATCLALAWAQNDHRIREIAIYIRDHMESSSCLNWETYMDSMRNTKKGLSSWRFVALAHSGIFLLTQVMAIVIGFSWFLNLVHLERLPLSHVYAKPGISEKCLFWTLLCADFIFGILPVAFILRKAKTREKTL